MDWRVTITDADEIKVFMALDGPRYTWRTISAIARQTGLTEERVAQILAKYNLTLTRLSETPSVSGSALVGLIEKVGV
jgi:DNA-directed RNA polymerase sigma subunit (sigma70/sigma32)